MIVYLVIDVHGEVVKIFRRYDSAESYIDSLVYEGLNLVTKMGKVE